MALTGVTCAFDPGVVTAIIGPNAAGKTTLLRILAGVLAPTSGRALLDDRPLRAWRPVERARRLAYLAQRPTLAAGFTVRQTLGLGRYALGPDPGAVDRALEGAEVADLANRGFHTLSAGQQQRVMLARALAQLDPWGKGHERHPGRFLIADEPTSAMDPRHAIATLAVFRSLADRGIGVVVAMHELTSAVRSADRAVAMGPDGAVAASGDVSQTLIPDILGPIYGVPFQLIDTPAGAVLTPVAPVLRRTEVDA
jgi:iron complex transport system ATP-binding protein